MQHFAAVRVLTAWQTVLCCVAAVGFALFADRCIAQPGVIIRPGRGAFAQQAMSGIDLPSDRTMARGIERAKDRISAGEFSQAIRFLDEVLAGKQDAFLAVGESGEHVGLKETASDMIRDLPSAGREMYVSTFGGIARKKLTEAVAAGDTRALQRVAQQYFYTPSGFEATLLVAQTEADGGRHLSAGLLYNQLLATPEAAERLNPQLALLAAKSHLALGETERAAELIQSARDPSATAIRIGGENERLPSDERDPLGWFEKVVGSPRQAVTSFVDQWLMPRGNAARNGHVLGGLPHVRVRWEARLLSHPQFESIYDELSASLEQRRQPLPTAGTPLAIGNTIITTTAHNLIAVDFRTGKRVWQTQPQRVSEFEQLLNISGDSVPFDTMTPPSQAFARRVWDDYLYNCVSSDGERVFVIRDLKIPEFNESDAWAMPFRGDLSNDSNSFANRLCAYDLATQGKLVWEIDGAAMQGDLAGAYFLGAPVVVDQKLYSLVEIKSAIHLVAIERQTGKVAWLQQLAGLQNGIYLDPLRRLQAAMPSYDSGMLVCPTGAGVVIGVNLEKNALAWAYQYETNRNPMTILRRNDGRLIEQTGQWIEGPAILAGGRVLLAPPESNFLHCLDLVTGKLLWSRERGDGMFVAGVDGDQVLIVGLNGLTALHLGSGEPMWAQQTASLSNNAMPSGRGFYSENKYFLPLTNAEVVGVDLANGKIVERTRSRSGTVLGNLISHQGVILSQNGKFLDCFDQIDVLREHTESQLAKNPDDSEALRTLGELVYNEGQLARAIELLERAYTLSPDDARTREVLGECLLEAVEQDFATYHDRLPQLREILEDSPQGTLSLLRIGAQGLLEMDKPWESFETCLQVYEQVGDKEELHEIDGNREVSVASWLRAQLAAIWQQAGSDDRVKIADRLTSIKAKLPSNGDQFSAFLECFGGIGDLADADELRHAEQLVSENRLLAAQQMYLNHIHPDDPLHGQAVANCSLMLHDRGLTRLAEEFDGLLAGPLADVTCLRGMTGAECLENWRKVLPTNTLDWPYGKVVIDQPPQNNAAVNRRVQVPLTEVRLEQSDGLLGRCNLFFSIRVGEFSIRDSHGREVFHQALGPEERQIFDPRGIYAAARGNLLIVSMGQQITAIDTLATPAEVGNVMWRKVTVRNPADRFRQGQNIRAGFERPGSHRTPRSQVGGRWVGVLGPITRDSVIYQDQRGLCCVDSLTGKTRWLRTNTPNACQLFGDDQVVIAVEEGNTKAQAFSTLDGRSLGEVEIPNWQEQLATRGLEMIAWERKSTGENRLSCRNVMSGTVSWYKQFSRGSLVDVAMNRYISIVEPTGRYAIIDAIDGSMLVDYEVDPIPMLRKVHLFAGTDQFVVAAEVAPQGLPNRQQSQFNAFDFVMFDGQLMAFNAKSGEPLWSRPADVRHESLMLSQPVDVPIITFVGNNRRQDSNGTQQLVNIMLLEKSTGRILFAEDSLPPSVNHCVVTANADSHEVFVEMVNRLVRLKFTDAPRPPEPPATFEAIPADREGPKGLYRILQKFGGGV
jgi:outer membrane protein assembly factor BamB